MAKKGHAIHDCPLAEPVRGGGGLDGRGRFSGQMGYRAVRGRGALVALWSTPPIEIGPDDTKEDGSVRTPSSPNTVDDSENDEGDDDPTAASIEEVEPAGPAGSQKPCDESRSLASSLSREAPLKLIKQMDDHAREHDFDQAFLDERFRVHMSLKSFKTA